MTQAPALVDGDLAGSRDRLRAWLAAHPDPDEALAFAHRLATGAPLAIQYTKQAVNAWIKTTAAPAFDLAQAYEIATFRSDDHQEALAALAERRPPELQGR